MKRSLSFRPGRIFNDYQFAYITDSQANSLLLRDVTRLKTLCNDLKNLFHVFSKHHLNYLRTHGALFTQSRSNPPICFAEKNCSGLEVIWNTIWHVSWWCKHCNLVFLRRWEFSCEIKKIRLNSQEILVCVYYVWYVVICSNCCAHCSLQTENIFLLSVFQSVVNNSQTVGKIRTELRKPGLKI